MNFLGHAVQGKEFTMTARAMDRLRSDFTPEEQRMSFAIGIVLDRVRRLSDEDSDDLVQLLKAYREAETEEDKVAADSAIMEVLDQRPVRTQVLDLTGSEHSSCEGKFSSWVEWIAERVKKFRNDSGLTQEQLSETSGLPQSHISRIENAKLSPSRLTLERIAAALKIELSELDPSAE